MFCGQHKALSEIKNRHSSGSKRESNNVACPSFLVIKVKKVKTLRFFVTATQQSSFTEENMLWVTLQSKTQSFRFAEPLVKQFVNVLDDRVEQGFLHRVAMSIQTTGLVPGRQNQASSSSITQWYNLCCRWKNWTRFHPQSYRIRTNNRPCSRETESNLQLMFDISGQFSN